MSEKSCWNTDIEQFVGWYSWMGNLEWILKTSPPCNKKLWRMIKKKSLFSIQAVLDYYLVGWCGCAVRCKWHFAVTTGEAVLFQHASMLHWFFPEKFSLNIFVEDAWWWLILYFFPSDSRKISNWLSKCLSYRWRLLFLV